MKFIVDAQLPVRLARFLKTSGYDTIHTRDLPRENATPDNEINAVSIQENRILITKDVDFINSFLTIQQPYKPVFYDYNFRFTQITLKTSPTRNC